MEAVTTPTTTDEGAGKTKTDATDEIETDLVIEETTETETEGEIEDDAILIRSRLGNLFNSVVDIRARCIVAAT